MALIFRNGGSQSPDRRLKEPRNNQLGAEYKADYMLLGRNSIGHHIVLVEFENVNVDFRLQNSNMETEAVRKGMTQINDWKRWMDNNRPYFLQSCGLSDIGRNIPTWGLRIKKDG